MLSFLLRVYKGFHTLLIRAFRLNEVDDIELVGDISPGIANLEVEPLSVVVGVIVILQN